MDDLEFTPFDLANLSAIEEKEDKTPDEIFLISLIDKFFYKTAKLKDEVNEYRNMFSEQA